MTTATAMKPCIKCPVGVMVYDPDEQWDKCFNCGDIQYHMWLVVAEEEPIPLLSDPPLKEESTSKPLPKRYPMWAIDHNGHYTTEEIEDALGYGEWRVRFE